MKQRPQLPQRLAYGRRAAAAIGLLILVLVAAGCTTAATAPGAAPAQTQPTTAPAPAAAASAMPEATTTSGAEAMTPAASASASAMPEASMTPAAAAGTSAAPAATAGTSAAPAASAQNMTGTPTGPALVKVAQNDKLGQFLVDARGMSLYMYTKDTKNTSNCYDKCATAWPPLYTNGAPQAGDGANASLLGTTQRTDGTTQVTYNGYPLYYWFKDQKPGDVSGQDVGKVWYVLSPAGEEITTPLAQPTAAAGGAAAATPAATGTAAGAAGATPAATQGATGGGAGGGQTVNVTIKDFKFGDGPLTVPAGTTVVWTNSDSAPHTVTADDGSFDSGNLNTGAKFQFTFKTPGTYQYYCTYHGGKGGSGMASKVIVQ